MLPISIQGLFYMIFNTESEKIWLNKKFSAAATIFFDEGILRSSQSETFKKGHKINTGIFYRKNANFFPINVLYKIFQIFNQKIIKIAIY